MVAAALGMAGCSSSPVGDAPDAGLDASTPRDAPGHDAEMLDAPAQKEDGSPGDGAAVVDAESGLDADESRDGGLDDAATEDADECTAGTDRACTSRCGTAGAESCGLDGRWSEICRAPPESCGNAVDDDCDGATDPPFGPIGSDVVVSGMPADFDWQGASDPEIGWTDPGFAIAYADSRTPDTMADVYLARRGPIGEAIGRDWIAGGLDIDRPTALVWTGVELGIAVRSNRGGGGPGFMSDVFLAIASPTGVPLASRSPSAGAGDWPAVTWTGSRFVLAWADYRSGDVDPFLASFRADGTPDLAPAVIEIASGAAGAVSVAWSGTEIGIAWSDARTGDAEIYFAHVDSAGALLGATLRVTAVAGASTSPALAWSGTSWGIFWTDGRDGPGSEIYFARIDASGARAGADVRLTTAPGLARGLSATSVGDGFVAVWADARSGAFRVYATRTDGDGVELGDEIRLSDAGAVGSASVARAGAEVGVAWDDDRSGRGEIYFARVGLCR